MTELIEHCKARGWPYFATDQVLLIQADCLAVLPLMEAGSVDAVVTSRGTYVAVASFHLDRYLDEQAWRFNNREANDGLRFQRVLSAVVGKRLTYRTLTAQGDAGFMGIR